MRAAVVCALCSCSLQLLVLPTNPQMQYPPFIELLLYMQLQSPALGVTDTLTDVVSSIHWAAVICDVAVSTSWCYRHTHRCNLYHSLSCCYMRRCSLQLLVSNNNVRKTHETSLFNSHDYSGYGASFRLCTFRLPIRGCIVSLYVSLRTNNVRKSYTAFTPI